MDTWASRKLAEMTVAEKASMLAGRNLWETVPVPRLGIPSLQVTDGPNGARGGDGNHGPTSASYPVGVAMGASFSPELITQVGRSLAGQARSRGASLLLGPTVNIPRVPVTGRNFECFSEDPLLSGTIAVAYIQGLQEEGIGACLKHFVCNDQETDRHTVSASVDQRTLREIYLEPFRIVLESAPPWAVMSAYNRINGVTASEHPLLNDWLREEMGFTGVVISDWFGTYSPGVIGSGLDLEMPGPARFMNPETVQATYEQQTVPTEVLDRKVERLLSLIEQAGLVDREPDPDFVEYPEDNEEDRELIRLVGTHSMVLLKNDGVLPLSTDQRVALIGEPAVNTPHQGGGSSTVNPHRVVSIQAGMAELWADPDRLSWDLGCYMHRNLPRLQRVVQPDGTPGFRFDYFRGKELAGEPARTVVGEKSYLAFFGVGDGWVEYEDFSLRISGEVIPHTDGLHRFAAPALGRCRVWAQDKLVVDRWDSLRPSGESLETSIEDLDIEEMLTGSEQPPTWTAELTAGQPYRLVLEFAGQPGDPFRYVGLGCLPPGPADPIAEAVAAAQAAEVAVVAAGHSLEWESEGFDRTDMRLPRDQNELITRVAAAQPNTVVVLTTGSPVEMPWLDQVAGVLQAWYGGQEVGHAVAQVLTGQTDPGGRLPITFPVHARQHPGMLNYPGEAGEVRYGEGVYVGYRGYDQLDLTPQFPFGFGLSYTNFSLRVGSVQASSDQIVLIAELTNTGDRTGREVVMVFAHDIGGIPRRLIGFEKYELEPGQTAGVNLPIPLERLRSWDSAASAWKESSGDISLSITGSFGSNQAEVSLPNS